MVSIEYYSIFQFGSTGLQQPYTIHKYSTDIHVHHGVYLFNTLHIAYNIQKLKFAVDMLSVYCCAQLCKHNCYGLALFSFRIQLDMWLRRHKSQRLCPYIMINKYVKQVNGMFQCGKCVVTRVFELKERAGGLIGTECYMLKCA